MARVICEYCETEYDDTMQRCPLCGTLNENAPEPEMEEEPRQTGRRKGGARVAKRQEKIPVWLTVLICVVLGLAVVIGAVYALYAMGVFSPDEAEDSDGTLSLPFEDDAQPGQTGESDDPATQPDDPVVDEPSVPVDLSCTGVSLTPATIRINEAGATVTLTLTVEPEGCTDQVFLTSSNEDICTVAADGTVTAMDGGTALITATCGAYSAVTEVTCDFTDSQENNAYLSVTDFTLFSVGEQAVIEVRDAPADAVVAWSTSNSGVCTVEDGVVTAVRSGTATITADVNGKVLECIARCSIKGSVPANDGNAENVGDKRLDHTDVTLGVGETFEISVVDGVSGGWNVTDSSIITVDNMGIVTAHKSGTAEVYTVIGGQRLACIVRVS